MSDKEEERMFFEGIGKQILRYFDRADFIGGQYYIKLVREQGKIILYIGDNENGELPVRIIRERKQYERLLDALRL